jgi:hypothetical protein
MFNRFGIGFAMIVENGSNYVYYLNFALKICKGIIYTPAIFSTYIFALLSFIVILKNMDLTSNR